MQTSIRRNDSPGIDTSERTQKLDSLKADRDRVINSVREDQDLTPEARSRKLQELSGEYAQKIAEAAADVMASLDREIERAYRAANPVDKPTEDHAADMAKELRYRRISDDVTEELRGGLNPIHAYDNAIRLGDEERAAIIAKLAPRFVDSIQRRDLNRRTEERLPEKVKAARIRLAQLEAERRSVEIGLTMQGVNIRR